MPIQTLHAHMSRMDGVVQQEAIGMGMSIGGLATGLDTKSIVDQLMSLEERPKIKLEWNKALWEARKSSWGDLNFRLNSLQGFANKLTNPASWTVFTGLNSTDPTRLTAASAGTKPAAGTYAVNISQLATTETWTAATNFPGATQGVRQSGVWREGVGNQMEAGDLLTATRTTAGAGTGLNVGSTITMAWEKDGNSYSSTYNVTAGSTIGNLTTWAQGQIPGSAASFDGAGRMNLTSAAGTTEEVTALSFSARNAAGTVLNAFNGLQGAQSSMITPAADGGATANDTLQITQGTSTWYVNVAAGDNETDLLNKINAVAGIGVTASLNAGKLELTSKASGAANGFTVTSGGPTVGALGMAETTNGIDSMFDVNGTAYTRSKNTGITDVLTDVSLDLLATTAGAVTLTVGQAAATTSEMKKSIMDFVNQYNSILDFVASKTGEAKVPSPKNLGEYLQGSLARDFGFSSVGFDMRRQMTDNVTGLPSGMSMLADIGITTGAVSATFSGANVTGKLVVDEAKLEAALNTDSQKVKDIFQKVGGGPMGEDGIARRVSNMVSQWRVGGKVDSALQGATSQITTLQDSIQRFSDRLVRKRAYFDRMFASLETNVGKMQTQGAWLQGQLNGLNNN